MIISRNDNPILIFTTEIIYFSRTKNVENFLAQQKNSSPRDEINFERHGKRSESRRRRKAEAIERVVCRSTAFSKTFQGDLTRSETIASIPRSLARRHFVTI